jgi:hypothetical protein
MGRNHERRERVKERRRESYKKNLKVLSILNKYDFD